MRQCAVQLKQRLGPSSVHKQGSKLLSLLRTRFGSLSCPYLDDPIQGTSEQVSTLWVHCQRAHHACVCPELLHHFTFHQVPVKDFPCTVQCSGLALKSRLRADSAENVCVPNTLLAPHSRNSFACINFEPLLWEQCRRQSCRPRLYMFRSQRERFAMINL